MGEFRVHHVKFYNYLPAAIHCLAYDETQNKLAVSRSDGSIEFWSLHDKWYHERTIVGSPEQSVEAIVWCGPRLFSGGLHGNLQEYDMLTLRPKCNASSNAGAIWCLAINDEKTHIAAGTEDGCVIMYRITEDGVEYERSFQKQEGRILSMAWHSGEGLIVTGGFDNIRIWSATSGHAIQRLTLSRAEKNKDTIVWAVAFTKDLTVVSGDSQGRTCFWNGKTGTLIKSFSAHKAGVLTLAVDKDGHSVFSSGVDPTVAQFQYIAKENSDWKQWVRSTLRNQHTHDVRALAITDQHIVSGGVDCQLILNHLTSKDGVKSWKRLPALPQKQVVQVAPSAKIVLFRYTNYVELWKLGSTNEKSDKNGEYLKLRTNPVKLLELKTRGEEHIVCTAISNNAEWLAYADLYQLRLFNISVEENYPATSNVQVSRVHKLPHTPLPPRCMAFTPDSSRLAAVTGDGSIHVIKLDNVMTELLHTFPPRSEPPCGIHLLSISPNGKYMATGDHGNNVNVYKISSCYKHLATLPSYKYQPTAIGFSPTLPEVAVTYCDQKIMEYNFVQKEYTEWSRRLNREWDPRWFKWQGKVTQIAYHPERTNELFLHDEGMFCILDKTQPIAAKCFHMCTKYKFLLHLEVLADDFLLVVERPPLAILESLPPTLKQKKFGT